MAEKDNHLIKNIYYMLSYAYQALREDCDDSIAGEEFDSIHDLFAHILGGGVTAQVKRGLHRGYLLREEAFAGVRGRILVAESIKWQTMRRGMLVCAHDEFLPDSPFNQALKSVMLLLVRHGNVKENNKRTLRKLLPYFSEVSEIAPRTIQWGALRCHRNNAPYRMLLAICRFVVEGLLLTTAKGTHRLARWLQDEAMHRLYQRFVLNYYKAKHREFSPGSTRIEWDIDDSGHDELLPGMYTDIVLQQGEKQLIIDTKYYSSTMRYHYDKKEYHSGNLYQIYTYVKNSDKKRTGNVAGMLLYAMTDETDVPDRDMMIGGNRISLKTIDLSKDWSEITEQLKALCAWLHTIDNRQ